ncbi:MAG: CRTAC1 family protein [Rhodothermales bacterium]
MTGAVGQRWFPETMGGGGGFVDYDGDGWADVVLVQGRSWDEVDSRPALRLYRNQQDGTFEEVTDAIGLGAASAYGMGLAAGDVDNDGDVDIVLTAVGANQLWRNDGERFTEVGEAVGIAGASTAWSTAAQFFDADHDGDLDLFIGNYVAWTPETDIACTFDGTEKSYCTPELYTGEQSRFYRNRGDGTFEDATATAGFGGNPGKTLGLTTWDINRDGWTDLLVASDREPDLLYLNDGQGRFEEVGVASGMAYDERGRARGGMGMDIGITDTTGQPTLFVANFSNEMLGVYRQTGPTLFLDRAAASKIGRASRRTLGFGLVLFDANLDGHQDVFVANGHIQPAVDRIQDRITYRQTPHLFLSQGDGTFKDIAPDLGTPFDQPLLARAAATADYDRDGDLDLLLVENGGPVHLWRNDLASPKALVLDVRTANGASALDALAQVYADGQQYTQRTQTGGSYLCIRSSDLHFALPSGRADSIVVQWPTGEVHRQTDVAGGQRLVVAP